MYCCAVCGDVPADIVPAATGKCGERDDPSLRGIHAVFLCGLYSGVLEDGS